MAIDYEELFRKNHELPLAFSDQTNEAIGAYLAALIDRNIAIERAKALTELVKKQRVGLVKIITEEVNPILKERGYPEIDINNDSTLKSFSVGYQNFFFKTRSR